MAELIVVLAGVTLAALFLGRRVYAAARRMLGGGPGGGLGGPGAAGGCGSCSEGGCGNRKTPA